MINEASRSGDTFKRILVYVNLDFGKYHALEQATKLARVSGGSLKVVDVVAELPVYLRMPAHGCPALLDILTKEKKEKLEAMAAPIRAGGVQVATEVFYGKPGVEIIREVLRNDHDLVMKTAEEGRLTRLFGPVAMRLLRKCPCPVWLAKPDSTNRCSRILAAVSLTDDRAGDPLDSEILRSGSLLSCLEGGELHVAHALKTLPPSLFRARGLVHRYNLRKRNESIRARATESLRRLLSPFAGDIKKEHVHLTEGDPGTAIPELVTKTGIDLVVMGSMTHRGLAGVFLGGTAEKVLGQLECSLLALKPGGFVSPIEVAKK